jgi:predicted ATP-dependent serine protease
MGKPIPYNEVKIVDRDTIKFGDSVFDTFISHGGGVELAVMIALSGTSGAGKTTLCKKWQADLKKDEVSVFYALESRKGSVARQTQRIATGSKELICDVDDFPKWSLFMEYLYEAKPTMAIVDSLQHSAELMSEETGIYVYKCYKKIIKDLYTWKDKTEGIAILICQLNEQGKMEGPASTLFDVDVSIKLTADEKTGERYLETPKNRMGSTGKLFYEFVSTSACIKFYTVEQWEIGRKKISLSTLMKQTVKRFLTSYIGHENYKSFMKDFRREYDSIYDNSEDDPEIIFKIMNTIRRLEDKYEMNK